MTTLHEEERTCALCGAKSEHTSIGSTNSMGSPDLDLRPPEMERSTMAYWVQECPNCGYAYRSIEETAPQTETTVNSDAYQAVLSSTLNGSITGRFLKASLISEGSSDPRAAAFYALYAAWAADDADDNEGAISHRIRAETLFSTSLDGVDETSEESILTRTRMVDILRRAERWEGAVGLADVLFGSELEPTVRSVLEFGRSAASRQDGLCYTIAKALGNEEQVPRRGARKWRDVLRRCWRRRGVAPDQ